LGRWAPVHQPRFMTEYAQSVAHVCKGYTLVCQVSTRDNDQIETSSQLRMELADGFAEPTFDQVALRGATDSTSDREAVPIVIEGIR